MPDILQTINDTTYFVPNLTVHKLRTYQTCKRKYLFSHVLRLRPLEETINYKLAVGAAYAAGLHVYRTTEGDLGAAMFTAVRDYILATGITDYSQLYNSGLLVSMIQAYDTAWPYWTDYRPFMYPNGELAIENEFQTTLDVSFQGQELIYSTKPDAIYISPENKILVIDDKTGYGEVQNGQHAIYDIDLQMCMYLHCSRENGIPAYAVELRHCRYLASKIHCYPDYIKITDAAVDAAVNLVNTLAEELAQSNNLELYNSYAANHNCVRCAYLDICRFGRWSEDFMTIKEREA